MDEPDVQVAATPVVQAEAKLNENQNSNSNNACQKPQSAGKLTLTDLWKKAKKKETSATPAGDVDVVVLDDPIAEAERGGNDVSTKEEPKEVVAGPSASPLDEPRGSDGLGNGVSAVADDGTVDLANTPTPSMKTTTVQTKKATARPKRGRSKKSSSKKVELVAVGSLHVQKGWFNSGYIFPLGYKARTQFRSSVDLNDHCMHECEVIGEGGEYWPKPTFRVVGSDRPDEPLVGKTPTACWTAVQKRINGEIERRRSAGEDLPPPPKTAIAGTEYFGFNHESVVEAIEALDVEKKVAEYWAGRETERTIEAVETEIKECAEAYGQQIDMKATVKAKPAASSDGSAITEDVDDLPLEHTSRGDADDDMAKIIVDGMVEAVEIAVSNAEERVKGEGDGSTDVVMEDAVAAIAPAAPVGSAQPYSDNTEGKPSKKRRSFSFDPSTVQDMEALYAKSSLPSKEDKVRLAQKHGIEVKQIESWMGKRRKADRDAANGVVKVKNAPVKKAQGPGGSGCAEGQPAGVSLTNGQATQSTPVTAHVKPQKSPRVLFSDEELQAKVQCTREMLADEATALKKNGLLPPLVDLESLAGTDPTEYSDKRLCYLAVGQRMTLSELVAAVSPLFDEVTRPSEDTMRASLALMLERKSADPVNKSVKALDRVDWKNSDDLIGAGLWQWEAKNKEHLDKPAWPSASAIKRRASKVHDRLKAIAALLSLSVSDSIEKIDKVVDSFKKSASLTALEEEAEAERKREKLKEDTERLKAEKKQEKERLKAEKEAEKLKAKEEKKVEKEQKKVEKEQKKLAGKTGFKDSKTLEKSANLFKSFFGAKASSADRDKKEGDEEARADKRKEGTYYERRFLKPTQSQVREEPAQVSLEGALASTKDHEELVAEFRASMKAAHAKYLAEQTDLKKRCLGLPPSWARKADAIEVAEHNMHQLTSNGMSPDSIQTFRRKFIYVKDAYTVRPPFYGSRKPLETNAVGPRRFLGMDPSLDYEVMSDEDWEEEPEGSSLSKDDVMSEEDDGEEDENSFCVGDGYLSADEGIRSDDDGVIPMDESDLCIISKGSKTGRLDLHPYLEKSRRSGKPFVFVRGSADAEANHGACYRGDTALCTSLEMEILLPGARLEVPDLDEEKLLRQQVSEKPAKKDDKSKANLEELLPDLTSYIQANAVATKPSLIDGFVERHKERKLTKKWVGDSISALASRSGKTWKIKATL